MNARLLFMIFISMLVLVGCAAAEKNSKGGLKLEIPVHDASQLQKDLAPVDKDEDKNSPPKRDSKKPIEVGRVCFDKKGTMHICDHKIPKPYEKRELPY